MVKNLEKDFNEYCINNNLEINKNQIEVIKKLENFSKNNPLEPKKDYSDSREAMRALLRSPTPMEKDWQTSRSYRH